MTWQDGDRMSDSTLVVKPEVCIVEELQDAAFHVGAQALIGGIVTTERMHGAFAPNEDDVDQLVATVASSLRRMFDYGPEGRRTLTPLESFHVWEDMRRPNRKRVA